MNIAFIDSIDWDYDASSPYERPLGGSQSALCYLAVALAGRGHTVSLYTNTTRPRVFQGVNCRQLQGITPADFSNVNVAIVLNGPAELCFKVRPYLPAGCRLILWTQHAHDQPAMSGLARADVRTGWDLVVCVSQWHAMSMARQYGLDPARVAVMRNAIGPAFVNLFNSADDLSSLKSPTPLLAYTSTPFRGLDVLMALFPDFWRRNPDLRLRIYSSMKVYGAAESSDPFAQLYGRCRTTPGVEYVGSLPQPRLAEQLKSAWILAYPNTFPETSCIAVMEAMAAGMLVVTSDLGALPETTHGHGALIPGPKAQGDIAQFSRAFAEQLDEAIKSASRDFPRFCGQLWEQVKLMNSQFTWPVRAAEWERLLTSISPNIQQLSFHSADLPPSRPSLQQLLASAMDHLRNGRLSEAEALCRETIQQSPRNAEAYRILGVVAFQRNDSVTAIQLLRQAVSLAPESAEYIDNLSAILIGSRQWSEAEQAARSATLLNPVSASAWSNLAAALVHLDRLADAELAQRRAIELNPGLVESELARGEALIQQGVLDEAELTFRLLVASNPNLARAFYRLGSICRAKGNWTESEQCYRNALAIDPAMVESLHNLGSLMVAMHRNNEAIALFREALQIRPSLHETQYALASALDQMDEVAEAESLCQNLADKFPASPKPMVLLGLINQYTARLPQAYELFKRAASIEPWLEVADSCLLMCAQYLPSVTAASLAKAHERWESRYGRPVATPARSFSNAPDPDRKLRIGFVSADFYEHSVGYLCVQLLESIDRTKAEVFCYGNQIKHDAVTARFKRVSTWRDVMHLSDDALAGAVRADSIDILVDLSGFTANNRMLTFARKPAPIQVTWAGYVGTTGLSAIDYLIADRFHVPFGEEGSYRDQIVRLPDGYICYDPPADAPTPGPLPAFSKGSVTFGSFSNPAKLNDSVISAWSAILSRVPGSRLILKYWRLDEPGTRRRVLALFASHGIAEGRVSLEGRGTSDEMRSRYLDVDIALDTFPYSGGVTTLEALWMGVPVITFPGNTFAGRHALSHLSNIGLNETIAPDLPGYIDRAVNLAGNLDHLAALRSTLRDRVRNSPLCDGARFARNFMDAMRHVWREWRDQQRRG